ncbi:hypothetical protein [Kribbella deserti]|uniref:Uncharacterized protein n=1 Tax=Kribbella deserti TaxID=1926257 RepID=A0ABV6QF21_9ACTN
MPTEFRRYRDQLGHVFSSAVSTELAKEKGWTEVKDDKSPATARDGRPAAPQPAPRDKVGAKSKSVVAASTNNTQGA